MRQKGRVVHRNCTKLNGHVWQLLPRPCAFQDTKLWTDENAGDISTYNDSHLYGCLTSVHYWLALLPVILNIFKQDNHNSRIHKSSIRTF
jgi:hypothetical protein